MPIVNPPDRLLNTTPVILSSTDLSPATHDTLDLGTSVLAWKKIFFPIDTSGGTARAGVKGIHMYGTGSDVFVGADNVTVGYYMQRSVVSNSAVTDYSADYSNLFQGDSSYQYLALNYAVNKTTVNGIIVGDGTTTPCEIMVGSIANAQRIGFGLDYTNKVGYISGLNPTKTANQVGIFEFRLNNSGTNFQERIRPDTNDKVDLGEQTLKFSSAFFSGGITQNIVSKTAAYTATDRDYTILCNATSAAFTITLPAAASHTGRIYNIKKTDSSANAVTIDGNASETIDGTTTKILNTQYDRLMIQCDGSNWHVI